MADRRTDIITNLERSLEDSISFFKSLTPAELGLQVYAEDPFWTVKQVLAHFIAIERSMQWLFKDMLSGGPGTPENFDLDHYNRTQPAKLDELSMDELVVQFSSVRQDTIAIVREMSEQDFDREGRHAFHGHGKLERFIRWTYEHMRIHENDIDKVLKKM